MSGCNMLNRWQHVRLQCAPTGGNMSDSIMLQQAETS
jgi:hypothetical protein